MTPLTLRHFSIATVALLPFASALSWSEAPHIAITKAALGVLPSWQQELLGEEAARLGSAYCLIPDQVYSDKENAKFAMREDKPGEVYLLNLHLPAQQAENLETLRYFMMKAVEALRSGKIGEAARFMGTICHQLEDYGSPSHTVPGDNMFTLLQQFLPPSEAMKDKLLHSPIESGELDIAIDDYQPALLGLTVEEASWRLMHRLHEAVINARSTTIPIIQALYAEDAESVTTHQLKAATEDARVVADALYTLISLGSEKFEEAERAPLKTVKIGAFFPVEAASLYYPQSQFFGQPHWGHPRSGVVLAGGTQAMPLKLRLESGENEFTNGISAGMGKTLTFPLPEKVYARFTVLAGLHPELGEKGRVEFTVSGDDKPLASVILNGTDPARLLECDLSGVSRIQLTLTSRGLDARSNYAIWADPVVTKP